MIVTSERIPIRYVVYQPSYFGTKSTVTIPEYGENPKIKYIATHGRLSAEHHTMLGAIMKCVNQIYQVKLITN